MKRCKNLLKKFLATASDYSWTEILPILLKFLNTSVMDNTRFSPLELMYGQSENAKSNFNLGLTETPVLQENDESKISKMTREINELLKVARDNLVGHKIDKTVRENKNRMYKDIKQGAIVFFFDNTVVKGTTQPLKTKYLNEPWVVMKSFLLYNISKTTCRWIYGPVSEIPGQRI